MAKRCLPAFFKRELDQETISSEVDQDRRGEDLQGGADHLVEFAF